jgi:DNA repair protein RadA/Sms
LTAQPVPADAVVFGEIGLSGEVRAVAQRDLRLKEAAKLGFRQAWVPRQAAKAGDAAGKDGLTVKGIGHVQDVVGQFAETKPRSPARKPSDTAGD